MFARSRVLPRVLSRTYATVSDSAGVKVAGIDVGQPTTSISVVVKAGSRYETLPGVAHALKNFAFKATSDASALRIVRETELYGGVLSAGLTREHLFLNAEFLRGDEEHFIKLLASVLSSSKYHPHEFAELVLPTLQSETLNAVGSPSTMALDLVHQVAFRRGLGNSLYASPHSPLSVSDVKSYASKAFAKSNIAVFGTGISTESLSEHVSKAFVGGSSSSVSGGFSSDASKYYGGEQRVPIDLHSGGRPTMIIAFGTSEISPSALSVIPELMGGQSALKWLPGTTPLSLAASKISGAKIQSFNLAYSDAGLVGIQITADTSEQVRELAHETVKIVKTLQGGKLEEEQVKKAIASAKFKAANLMEQKEGLMAFMGPQVLSNKMDALDFGKLDVETLSKATESLFKGKPSVVAVGELGVLPWADELGL